MKNVNENKIDGERNVYKTVQTRGNDRFEKIESGLAIGTNRFYRQIADEIETYIVQLARE